MLFWTTGNLRRDSRLFDNHVSILRMIFSGMSAFFKLNTFASASTSAYWNLKFDQTQIQNSMPFTLAALLLPFAFLRLKDGYQFHLLSKFKSPSVDHSKKEFLAIQNVVDQSCLREYFFLVMMMKSVNIRYSFSPHRILFFVYFEVAQPESLEPKSSSIRKIPHISGRRQLYWRKRQAKNGNQLHPASGYVSPMKNLGRKKCIVPKESDAGADNGWKAKITSSPELGDYTSHLRYCEKIGLPLM